MSSKVILAYKNITQYITPTIYLYNSASLIRLQLACIAMENNLSPSFLLILIAAEVFPFIFVPECLTTEKKAQNTVLLNAQIENQNHKPGSEREKAVQFPMLPEDLKPRDGFVILVFLQQCVKLTTPKLI